MFCNEFTNLPNQEKKEYEQKRFFTKVRINRGRF